MSNNDTLKTRKSIKQIELTPEQLAYKEKVKVDGLKFQFDKYFLVFLSRNPFWCEISRRITKIATDKISTAGVTWNEKLDNLVLYYNPEYLSQLTDKQIIGIIIHEFMHIVYGHLHARRRKPHKLWNFATDCAINSIIYNNDKVDTQNVNRNDVPLPLHCLMPGRTAWVRDPLSGTEGPVSEEQRAHDPYLRCIEGMKPMLTSDHYFAALEAVRQEQQKNKCPTCGGKGCVKKDKSQEQGDSNESGNSPGGNEGEQSGDKSDSSGDNKCSHDNCDCKSKGKGGKDKSQEPGDEGDSSGTGSGKDEYEDCPDCGGLGDSIETILDSMDDHDMWDDIPDDMREYINGRIRNMIEQAVSAADKQSNGWGNIPADIAAEIRQSISRKVPWRAVLRQFFGTLIPGDRSTSIRKINKRFPYIHPGLKRGRKAKLLIAVDQSGSVSDEMMQEFFGELKSLNKNVTIDILPFDCHANEKEIFTWVKGSSYPHGRQHCGGTDFDAPTNIVNDPKNRGRWDGMLIATDGCAPAPGSCRIKRGWILGSGTKLEFDSQELQVFIDNSKPLTGAWR